MQSMGNDRKFDTFVCEHLKRPLASPFGWSGTGETNQLGFGTTIEQVGCRWGQSFFSFESGFESFFDEAFAEVGDGIRVAMKLFGNFAVADSTMFCFIDGEEDIGVFNFLGVGFAFGNELGEFEAFFGGQGYLINRTRSRHF